MCNRGVKEVSEELICVACLNHMNQKVVHVHTKKLMRYLRCPSCESKVTTREAELLATIAELRENLARLWGYCDAYADFRNGITHDSLDEGSVNAQKVLDKAKQALEITKDIK